MTCHMMYVGALSACVVFSSSVCQASPDGQEPPVEERIDDARRDVLETLKRAGRTLDEFFADSDEFVVISELGLGSISARELLGARVRSGNGDAVGSVEELIIDGTGDLKVAILDQVSLLGIGGTSVPLGAKNLVVYRTTEGRVEVRTSLTEGELARSGGTVYVIRAEVAGQWAIELIRMSALLGADIVNPNGIKIAQLHDVIFNRQRDITHVILAVGGFLGIGEKLIAAPLDSADILRTREGLRLVISVSKETLEELPAFRYDAPSDASNADGTR